MNIRQPMVLRNSSATRKANSENGGQFGLASEDVMINTEYQFKNLARASKGLCLAFTSSASGGAGQSPRKTDFSIHIGAKDYAAILYAKGVVDRKETLLATVKVVQELSAAIQEELDEARTQKTNTRMLMKK